MSRLRLAFGQLHRVEHPQVEVEHSDGLWHPGSPEVYRQLQGVWSGYVRYRTSVSETRLGCFEKAVSFGFSSPVGVR